MSERIEQEYWRVGVPEYWKLELLVFHEPPLPNISIRDQVAFSTLRQFSTP